jgi:hypothetical protein
VSFEITGAPAIIFLLVDRGQSTSVWLKFCILLLALAGVAWLLTGSAIILGLAAGLAGVAVLAVVSYLRDVLDVPWNRPRDR